MSILIRSQIDEFDEFTRETIADEDTAQIDDQETLSTPTLSMVQGTDVRGKVVVDGHITLQSQQPPAPLSSFEASFHIRLAAWLTAELAAINVQLPHAVVFHPGDLVSAPPVSLQRSSLDAV